jgi:hypothetical protein
MLWERVCPPDRGLTSDGRAFLGNAARMSTADAPVPTVSDDLAVRSGSVQLFRTYDAGIIAVAIFESVLSSPLEFTAVTW